MKTYVMELSVRPGLINCPVEFSIRACSSRWLVKSIHSASFDHAGLQCIETHLSLWGALDADLSPFDRFIRQSRAKIGQTIGPGIDDKTKRSTSVSVPSMEPLPSVSSAKSSVAPCSQRLSVRLVRTAFNGLKSKQSSVHGLFL